MHEDAGPSSLQLRPSVEQDPRSVNHWLHGSLCLLSSVGMRGFSRLRMWSTVSKGKDAIAAKMIACE